MQFNFVGQPSKCRKSSRTSIETESRLVVSRANAELLLNGHRVSVSDEEKVLEMYSGDHGTTMSM